MIHVDLQDTLGLHVQVGLYGGEVFLHLKGETLAAGQAHRVGLQLGAGLDLRHLVAQRLLDEVKGLLVPLRLVRLGLAVQLQLAVHHAAEGLVPVLAEQVGDKAVGIVGKVQHLIVVLLHQLRLGQVVDGLHVLAGGVVDELLALRHTVHILVQRHQLLLLRGVEHQQILHLFLVDAVVVQGAQLQLAAVAAVELLVVLPLVLQHPQQLRLDLLLQIGGNDLQLAVMLQQFPGNIQAQVGRIHHAADEVEVLRQQIGTVIHNHDAGAVKLQTGLEILGKVLVGHPGGNEQQRLIGDGALHGNGDHRLGRGHLTEALLIELVVFLPGDLALFPLPQGHHGVEGLKNELLLVLRLVLRAALLQLGVGHQHPDGEADIVAVLFHQPVKGILPQVLAVLVLLLLGVGLDVHDDIGSHRSLLAGLDGVAVHAGGLPAVRLIAAVLFRHHGDLIRHHKGRVEAHTELSDDIGVRSLLVLQIPLEAEAAAVGNDAQIVLQIVLVHADAVVADGEGTVVLVDGQRDLEIVTAHPHLVIGQAEIAQLVNGVRGVGDDLPQENLLMGIDGVDHQIQQPFGLRFELFLSHSIVPFYTERETRSASLVIHLISDLFPAASFHWHG